MLIICQLPAFVVHCCDDLSTEDVCAPDLVTFFAFICLLLTIN